MKNKKQVEPPAGPPAGPFAGPPTTRRDGTPIQGYRKDGKPRKTPPSRRRSFRPPGRIPLLTPKLQARIVDAVRGGLFQEQAAVFVGISKSSFFNWKRQGELDQHENRETMYTRFLTAVENAMTYYEAYLQNMLGRMAPANFNALRYNLQVRNKERYVINDRIELPPGSNVTFVWPSNREDAPE
jgi:hypothetical protein